MSFRRVTSVLAMALFALSLGAPACSGASNEKRDKSWRVEKTDRRGNKQRRKKRRRAPKHERHDHAHGGHPHEEGGHHHHPHPHPHLDGPDGHHHPY